MPPTVAPRPRRGRVKWAVALGLVAVTVAGTVGSGIVGPRVHSLSGGGYGELGLVLLFTVEGFVLAVRRPRNPIGWLFLSVSACFILSSFASAYTTLDYTHDHGTLPLGWMFLLFAEFWAPAIVLFSMAALLFPDGRPDSRVTRLLLAVLLLAAAVWQAGAFGIAVSAIVNHAVHIDKSGDLYAIDHPVGAWAWWYSAAQPAFFVTLAATWIGWLIQQVPAYRRSVGDRRLQFKWLYAGVAVCGIGGVLIAAFTSASGPLHALGVAGDTMLCALPLSLGIALLKFHLYDIDKVVSRTVSYVLLTGMLIGLYVGVVALATKGADFSSPVGVAASTLIAAALFNPLRRRLQRGVDRRFNRARYDAERTVSAFAARLRESVDPDSVSGDLVGVVHSVFEPASAGVWIRPH